MKDFCIVGSGISGSTIANLLSKKYTVEIFDKARGPGGRASSRRYKNNLNFDHGLQYFSPKSREFKKFILNLKKKSVLKDWTGKHLDFTFERKEKSLKFIGRKGNSDINKYLIKNIKANYKFNNNIQAPISDGDVIGDIEFMSDSRVVLSAPLIAIESVEAKGFFGRIWSRILFWIMSLFSISEND